MNLALNFHFEKWGYGLYTKMMILKKQVLFTVRINSTSIDSKLSYDLTMKDWIPKQSCSYHGCNVLTSQLKTPRKIEKHNKSTVSLPTSYLCYLLSKFYYVKVYYMGHMCL